MNALDLRRKLVLVGMTALLGISIGSDQASGQLTLPPLNVYQRIDIEVIQGRTELGWVPLPNAPVADSASLPAGEVWSLNDTETEAAQLVSLTGDIYTIALNNTDASGVEVGQIDWRDRGDKNTVGAPEPLVLVGEDIAKNNGGVIRIELGDMAAGSYHGISYHIDPDFAQSGQIDVLVSTDGGATFLPPQGPGNANFLVAIADLGTATVEQTKAEFDFTANGVDDVIIIFDGRGHTDTEVPLNGIELFVTVPEPQSLGLLAVGLVALFFHGPHRSGRRRATARPGRLSAAIWPKVHQR